LDMVRNGFLLYTNNDILGCKSILTIKSRVVHIYEIKKGDSIVADFIPVRVGSEGCLYDRVRKTIFHNEGTGDFVLGSDKN